MNEEEKKAIEICKNITTDDLLDCWDFGEEEYNAIQIVLNLIEKQQKENKKLEEENKELKKEVEKLTNARNLYKERDYYKARYSEFNEAFIQAGKDMCK